MIRPFRLYVMIVSGCSNCFMEVKELLKKVRRIEIKAKGLTNEMFSGEYHSAFKGRGMSFSEVREYQYGDDIRNIDWNVTARFDHPYVKVYEEEREMTVMLILDVSGSEDFGTRSQLKREILTEISAVIAFSVIQNNDKIGVILFSDRIELFIPPRKGKSHVLRIIRDLLNFEPSQKGTDIGMAVKYFTSVVKKKSTAFLISDFMDTGFEDALKIASRKHDLISFRLRDPMELELPKAGMVKMLDTETGEMIWVDTEREKVRKAYNAAMKKRESDLAGLFTRSGMDYTVIDTSRSYVQPIHTLFRKREMRR